MSHGDRSGDQVPFDVLLFDLGGVLVEWDGVAGLVDLARRRLSREQARRAWISSVWVRRFEAGRCSSKEFSRGMVEEMELAVSPESFLEHFSSWDRGPFPGALELLDQLRSRHTLACLTNNNAIHWCRLRDDFGFGPRFHYAFPSHEIGLVKPDRAVYEHVLKELGCPAHRVLFLDDNPECIDGARVLGIEAEQVQGIDAVHRALEHRGLIPATPSRPTASGTP